MGIMDFSGIGSLLGLQQEAMASGMFNSGFTPIENPKKVVVINRINEQTYLYEDQEVEPLDYLRVKVAAWLN